MTPGALNRITEAARKLQEAKQAAEDAEAELIRACEAAAGKAAARATSEEKRKPGRSQKVLPAAGESTAAQPPRSLKELYPITRSDEAETPRLPKGEGELRILKALQDGSLAYKDLLDKTALNKTSLFGSLARLLQRKRIVKEDGVYRICA